MVLFFPPISKAGAGSRPIDRKSTRLNSSHSQISYAVFCLKKKKHQHVVNFFLKQTSTLGNFPRLRYHSKSNISQPTDLQSITTYVTNRPSISPTTTDYLPH